MGTLYSGEYEQRQAQALALASQQQSQFLAGLQGLGPGFGSGLLAAAQASRGGLYNGKGEKVPEKPKTFKDELQEEIDEWLEDI